MGKKNKGKKRPDPLTSGQHGETTIHAHEVTSTEEVTKIPSIVGPEIHDVHRESSVDSLSNEDPATGPEVSTLSTHEIEDLTDKTKYSDSSTRITEGIQMEALESAEQSLLDDLIAPVSDLTRQQNETMEKDDNDAQRGNTDSFRLGASYVDDVDPTESLSDASEGESRINKTLSLDNGHASSPSSNLHDSQHECEILKRALEDKIAIISQVKEEKAQVEGQYRSLFGKVTQMKSTLGARLKQDAEELALNRALIEDLESQNSVLNETVAHVQEQVVIMTDQLSNADRSRRTADERIQELTDAVTNLEQMLAIEQRNREAAAERDMMTTAERENLALEEKTARDTLRDRIHDLEEQLSAQNTAYQNLLSIVEQDNQANTKLKQNIYELQESHQDERKTLVEAMQHTIDDLQKEQKTAQERMNVLTLQNNDSLAELEKYRPYEREAKEKNLLIGKLRHEAVILNEHLTKALRLLKRGSSTDSVDRQLLNNLLLSFFQLPRQDSKRFEVLKILASVLAWDEVQKEQAGLIRPGSTSHLLTPLSPSLGRSPPASPGINRGSVSRRTIGAIQLQAADFMGPNKESMSDLWINFLQTEAATNAADTVDHI